MGHILIVDDDELTRSLLSKKLTKIGYEANQVSSGAECLEAVGRGTVDLILLDMMMPEKSGLETLAELRKSHSRAEIPVIMMTSDDAKETATVNALQAGANDFISKPISGAIVKARIDTQLKMVTLHRQIVDKHRLETINAMITTYNHEINNPLAIAIGLLQRSNLKEDEARFEKVMTALTRIKDIVINIRNLQSEKVNFENYTRDSKMIKLP